MVQLLLNALAYLLSAIFFFMPAVLLHALQKPFGRRYGTSIGVAGSMIAMRHFCASGMERFDFAMHMDWRLFVIAICVGMFAGQYLAHLVGGEANSDGTTAQEYVLPALCTGIAFMVIYSIATQNLTGAARYNHLLMLAAGCVVSIAAGSWLFDQCWKALRRTMVIPRVTIP